MAGLPAHPATARRWWELLKRWRKEPTKASIPTDKLQHEAALAVAELGCTLLRVPDL